MDTTPAWGTPEDGDGAPAPDAPPYGSPPYGSPPYGSPPYGTYEHGTPAHGTPAREIRPSLLTAGTVIVTERSAFMSERTYDLTTPDGDPLATLVEETTAKNWFFGSAASSRFELLDPAGELIAVMDRPGAWGDIDFVVTDHRGSEVGTISQRSRWFSSTQLDFVPVEGAPMRMVGAGWGSGGRRIAEYADERVELGLVTRELAGLAGFLAGTERFAVVLSPGLTGGRRLLALMAASCMDYIRDEEQRSRNSSSGMNFGGSTT